VDFIGFWGKHLLELPVYCFSGTPVQVGHAYGESLKEQIQRFVAIRLDAAKLYFLQMGVRDKEIIAKLLEVGKKCCAVFKDWDKEGWDEHNAVASAANVDPDDLYTVINYTDVRDAFFLTGNKPDAEGCSAFLVPFEHTMPKYGMLSGQTWDLNPEDVEFVVAVKTIPDKGPERWSIQVAGCLGLMGMNSAGISVGTTNLKTMGCRVGVGYTNLIHKALRSTSFEDVASEFMSAPVSGAHSYFIADSKRGIHFELSSFIGKSEEVGNKSIGWTNHCRFPENIEREYELPSESSLARFDRLNDLLQGDTLSVERLKNILADRENGVDSINRYPEDSPYTATNACMIADNENIVLHACRGPSDKGEWKKLTFS